MYKKELQEKYNKGDYNIVSINKIKEFIELKKDNHRWVNKNDFKINSDILCSTLYYTKEVSDQIKFDDWSQKFYLIYHNLINNLPKAEDDPTKLPSYQDFSIGYALRTKNFGKNRREVFKEIVEKRIKDTGYEILKSYEHSDRYKKMTLKCSKCQKEFSICVCNGKWQNISCPSCSCSTSKAELELVEFIKSLTNTTIIEHDRSIIKPQELDIYIPEYKIAIEYNGMFWHSIYQGKDQYYHLNKTNKCKEKGINLIHIFEKDWQENKEFIKNKLRCIFNKNKIVIDNKDFIIKEYDNKYGYNVIVLSYGKILCKVKVYKSIILDWYCNPDYNEYNLYKKVIKSIKIHNKLFKNLDDTLYININNSWSTDIQLFEKIGFKNILEYKPWLINESVWNCGSTLLIF